MDSFFLKRDEVAVQAAFDEFANGDKLPLTALGFAMGKLALTVESDALVRAKLKASEEDTITLHDFKTVIAEPSRLQSWASHIPLAELLASAVDSQTKGHEVEADPLQVLAVLSPEKITDICRTMAAGLEKVLTQSAASLNTAYKAMKQKDLDRENGGKAKFSTFKMSCGTVDDFFGGLAGRVGTPHLDFMKAIEAEHCLKAGCDVEFTASNYQITTTAKKEWDIVIGRSECPEHQRTHNRSLHTLQNLMELELTKKAGLALSEVIALVLYTGPMFMVYNSILRRFPASICNTYIDGNNTYTTTIHVLVSGCMKIARCLKIPDSGLMLYRGLGGLMELPEQFWVADQRGCKGYMEWGFCSTTSHKSVAMQYSGVKEGRPLAMVLEMSVGAVDRGACIRDYSQFPAEVEYLWVPCSYLEPVSVARTEATVDGVVTVIPTRINANLLTETIEGLVARKKKMHLASFVFLLDEIKMELEQISHTDEAKQRWERDTSAPTAKLTLDGFVSLICRQLREIFDRHDKVEPTSYAKDEVYQSMGTEMLESRKFALSKFLWWLEDDTQKLEEQGGRSYSTVGTSAQTLRGAHLGRITFLENLADKLRGEEKTEERKAVAMKLCKLLGLVKESIDEKNLFGETPFFSVACSGSTSFKQLQLLVWAGADVNGYCGKETPLFIACQKGETSVVKDLHTLGANFKIPVNGVLYPLTIAAKSKHLPVLELAVSLGVDINISMSLGRMKVNVYSEARQHGEEFLAAVVALGAKP